MYVSASYLFIGHAACITASFSVIEKDILFKRYRMSVGIFSRYHIVLRCLKMCKGTLEGKSPQTLAWSECCYCPSKGWGVCWNWSWGPTRSFVGTAARWAWKLGHLFLSAVVFSSVAKLCLTLCDHRDCSTPGFPVLHRLPEFLLTHVHWVHDTNQPSHPPSSPSPPVLSLSQHQGLSYWVHFSHQVAKVLELQLQHLSFQWILRVDFL